MPSAKREERLAARDLYHQHKTISEIATILNVARASVSLWCRDLITQNKQDLIDQRKAQGLDIRIGVDKRNGQQILSDDNVVAMRRLVRSEGFKGHAYYANLYHTTIACVTLALRGKTFKHVNIIEPPFEQDFRKSALPRSQEPQDPERVERIRQAKKRSYESLKQFRKEHDRYEREMQQGC